MPDMTVYSIVRTEKDERGSYLKIVFVHHNGDIGNGDPNEEYFVTIEKGLPGGNIPVIDWSDFKAYAEVNMPRFYQKVDGTFTRAIEIRNAKIVSHVKGIRKITADFLRKAYELVTN